eukprot:COSAG01_NODE_2874_length_6937_cov_4.473823_8_plen_104_part_00
MRFPYDFPHVCDSVISICHRRPILTEIDRSHACLYHEIEGWQQRPGRSLFKKTAQDADFPDYTPFYAGFGNRPTDGLSYQVPCHRFLEPGSDSPVCAFKRVRF